MRSRTGISLVDFFVSTTFSDLNNRETLCKINFSSSLLFIIPDVTVVQSSDVQLLSFLHSSFVP